LVPYIDVPARDREQSRRFYGEIFGWHFEDYPGVEYTGVVTSEDGIESGLGTLPETVGLSSTGTGRAVHPPDRLRGHARGDRKGGGKILIPKTDVAGYGWFAHFADPDGNVIGLWQDAEH
jgi:predicted enzyme related to lactoylglutathione lyase